MNDFNDGKIHGWNGGDCPVHPESKVEYWLRRWASYTATAGGRDWGHTQSNNDIIAFRVVEPYVEPKTVWVNEYPGGDTIHKTEDTAKRHAGIRATRIAVEYREVKK